MHCISFLKVTCKAGKFCWGAAQTKERSSCQLRRILLEPDCGLVSPNFVLTLYLLHLSQPGSCYLKDSIVSMDNTWVLHGPNKVDESASSIDAFFIIILRFYFSGSFGEVKKAMIGAGFGL
mgnify:CR=1 FL=1